MKKFLLSLLLAASSAFATGAIYINGGASKGGSYTVTIQTLGSTTLYACAYNQLGGLLEPIPGVDIAWNSVAFADSGNHYHSGTTRPNGIFSTSTGVTAGNGCVSTVFYADVYATEYNITAVGEEQGRYVGTDYAQVYGENSTGWTQLTGVPAAILENDATHPQAFAVTQQMARTVNYIFGQYALKYASNPVTILRGSLYKGGWLDSVACAINFPATCQYNNSEGKEIDFDAPTTLNMGANYIYLLTIINHLPPQYNYCSVKIGNGPPNNGTIPSGVWHLACSE